MQNHLFHFVREGNFLDDLYFFIMIKKNSFLQLNCRHSRANNFSQVVAWPVQDYRRMYSHFPSGPRHGL